MGDLKGHAAAARRCGHGVGVDGAGAPGAAFQHADPGRGEEAGLGDQLAAVLEPGAESAAEGLVDQDNGFGGRRSGLGPAEDQGVHAKSAQRFGIEAGGDGVGEARAVEMDLEPRGLGRARQGFKFGLAVEGAELGGVGERQRRRRLPMGMVGLAEGGGELRGLDPA